MTNEKTPGLSTPALSAENQTVARPHDLDVMTEEQARALTEQIRTAAENLWELIARAYVEGAWRAMGYESWDAYCRSEFGSSRIRLPLEEREEVVTSLREQGLSIRAIAAGTGTGTRQVQEALADHEVCSQTTPEAAQVITGMDGKRHPARKKKRNPPPPRPQPQPEPVEPEEFVPHRFWHLYEKYRSPSIWLYVIGVCQIGLDTEDCTEDLAAPLAADELPPLGNDHWSDMTDAEFASELADRLRAALPRIQELIGVLDEWASTHEQGFAEGSGP